MGVQDDCVNTGVMKLFTQMSKKKRKHNPNKGVFVVVLVLVCFYSRKLLRSLRVLSLDFN